MELNGIANLKILADELRQGAEILNDSSTNEIVKKALLSDLDSLNQQIAYLHEYMKEIAELHRVYEIQNSLPYWHEIKAKVDSRD